MGKKGTARFARNEGIEMHDQFEVRVEQEDEFGWMSHSISAVASLDALP